MWLSQLLMLQTSWYDLTDWFRGPI